MYLVLKLVMKFTKEFKEAIVTMPSSEKDKLLLRLLKKDPKLANRLSFELLSEDSVEEKRKEVKAHIASKVSEMHNTFYSIGYLLMDLRFLSGDINEHVSITKDKLGEVTLNIWMLTAFLEKNTHFIENPPKGNSYKLSIYIIARAFKILTLIVKLHPDLFLEFREELSQLGKQIGSSPTLMHVAIHNGLDVNWLIKGEIPDDIIQIHREIRQQGFLK